MKTAIALAASALLAGCASGPYYAGYGAYDTYTPFTYGYTTPYYGSAYSGAPYYSYSPGTVGGSIYYYDRSHDWRDDWRDRRDWNRHDGRGSRDLSDRGRRDDPRAPRESQPSRGLDTRHGEAGNEAGM